MNTGYVLRVTGIPGGKARPRVTRGGTHTYSPDPQGFQERVAVAARAAHVQIIEGPVLVKTSVYRVMPKGWSMAKRTRMTGRPATKKPDSVNIQAAVFDGLQHIAYHDDVTAEDGGCNRYWSEVEETVITLTPLGVPS